MLGVRPEQLTPQDDGQLDFEIELVEPLGADTLLHCRFGEARELVTVRMAGHVLANPGERRRFAVAPDKLHVFNAQTGKRVADNGQ
jgi:sn-glycerol 3-phosphate transport system ATP-binding protein